MAGGNRRLARTAAPVASPSIESSDRSCVGNEVTRRHRHLVQLAQRGTRWLVAPSAGVITKWKVNVAPAPDLVHQTSRSSTRPEPSSVLFVGEATGTTRAG